MATDEENGARQKKPRSDVLARIAKLDPEDRAAWEAKQEKRRRARRYSVEPVGRRPKTYKNRSLEELIAEVQAGRLSLAEMEPRETDLWLQYLGGTLRPKQPAAPRTAEEEAQAEDDLENEMALNRLRAWYGSDPARLKREIQDFWHRRQRHRRILAVARRFLKARAFREDEVELRKLFETGEHTARTAFEALGKRRSHSWCYMRWRQWSDEREEAAATRAADAMEREAELDRRDPGRHERERAEFMKNLALLNLDEDDVSPEEKA